MPDLSIKYLGLDLKSPVIAGSSSLTNSIEHLKAIEKQLKESRGDKPWTMNH